MGAGADLIDSIVSLAPVTIVSSLVASASASSLVVSVATVSSLVASASASSSAISAATASLEVASASASASSSVVSAATASSEVASATIASSVMISSVESSSTPSACTVMLVPKIRTKQIAKNMAQRHFLIIVTTPNKYNLPYQPNNSIN